MLRSAYAVQARRKASRWPWDGPGKVAWADVISRACLSALVDGLSPVGGEKRSSRSTSFFGSIILSSRPNANR